MSEIHYSSPNGEDILPNARTLRFRGISGVECEDFVQSVRFIALTEGKDDDDRWMLRFATARLSGRALRWHARLDKVIRQDWDLLVQALLDEYPVVDPDAETLGGVASPAPISTPLATSPQAPAVSLTTLRPQNALLSPGLNVGRLRIAPISGHSNALYVSKDIALTTSRADALQVQFLQSTKSHSIGLLIRG